MTRRIYVRERAYSGRAILFGATALVAALCAAEYPRGLRAQSLSLPTYTSAQAAQGKQAYEKTCSACSAFDAVCVKAFGP